MDVADPADDASIDCTAMDENASGEFDDDPVAFTASDRQSLIMALILGAIFTAGATGRRFRNLAKIHLSELTHAYAEGNDARAGDGCARGIFDAAQALVPDKPLPLAVAATVLGLAIRSTGLVYLRQPLAEEIAALACPAGRLISRIRAARAG